MLIFLCALFRLLLDFAYAYFVSVNFDYQGYLLDFNALAYVVSWALYLSVSFIVSNKFTKVSDYFFVIAVLSFMAPLTSYFGLSDKPVFPVFVSVMSIFVVYFVANFRYVATPKIPRFVHGKGFAVALSTFGVGYLLIWYFLSGAATNINFNLAKVYEFRSENSQLTDVGLLAYLNSWVYQVFTIFLIAYCLWRNKLWLAFFVIAVQVFFFSVSAHKSILFYPFMIFGLWLYFRKHSSMLVVPVLFSIVVLAALCTYFIWGEIFFGSLFIRRVFFVPSWLTYGYFDFFSNNEKLYWSNSILSSFLSYPYQERVTVLVGQHLGSGGSGNNGFISSGYAHAGVLGVLFYSAVLGYFLKFLDTMAAGAVPLWLALSITIIPLRSALLSSDLFTVFLTHGLLVATVLLILMRVGKRSAENISRITYG